jgi:hypothetical protein
MTKSNSLDHAKHNENVCNFISGKEQFGDWIITTAFYSTIHYVRHLMLPGVLTDGTQCNSFEELFYDKKLNREGRHGFQRRFVDENCKPIRVRYAQLHDECNLARYSDYNYPRKVSNEAKETLRQVKEYVLSIKLQE